MTDERQRATARVTIPAVRMPVVVGLVIVMVLCWIFATPRSAGPDEPGHQVRGAALVRGQLDGVPFTDFDSERGFELPGEVGFPDPACFAFNEFASASCTNDLEPPAGTTLVGTRSADYPIWGHLPAGLGTFVPGDASGWMSRIADAVLPLALLVGALGVARRRGALAVGSVLLAATPMVWFMFAVVNPSGLVIAGGIGLWVAATAKAAPGPDRVVALLASCSWAAMVLPRRDGMVWAALVVAVVVLLWEERPLVLARRLGAVGGAIVALATLATLAWASRSGTNAAAALFVAPLAPVAAAAVRRAWNRVAPRGVMVQVGFVGAVAGAACAASLAVMSLRSDGFDREVLERVIGRTGNDLTEAVGVLGWLDAPVPTSMVYLWVVGLGIVVGAAVMLGARRQLAVGAVTIVGGVVASWALTMLQNDSTGEYWQGRYYLPFLVGIPIVLGTLAAADAVWQRSLHRVGLAAASVGLVVSNVALAAMMRRFGVGRAGSMVPWAWDTYDAPVPLVLLLMLHGVASVGLLLWVAQLHAADDAQR